jgi:acetyltransferase-like isoleucine patch superfamily enzyme
MVKRHIMARMVTGHMMLWRFRDLNRDGTLHLINCFLTLGRSSIQTRIARMPAWWPGTEIGQHAVDWRNRQAGKPGEASPVVIGDDVWLGMNVTVLKGVEVGRQTVVGAGSIVTRSLPSGVIAAGQPAVVIRKLDGCENPGTMAYRILRGAKFSQ